VAGQGVDGKGYSYTIYSRQYQNGKVFFRTRGNYNEDFDVSTAVGLELGGTYQELLSDGSLGIPSSSATFRNGQGRIMVSFSSDDSIPPGAINGFGAEPGDAPGSIRLSWTETGDDGYTGNATYTSVKYSTDPITADNWIQATAVPNPPTPSTPNQTVAFDIQGLTPGGFYYIGLQTYDEAGLGSGIAVTSSLAKSDESPETDTIPPGKIEDLGAEIGLINGSVVLSWTATGDDNRTGTAAAYEIRYHTDSLGEPDWELSSDVYPFPPTPQPAGYPESVVIDNLIPGLKYWFSVIATDDEGNPSEIAVTSGYARGIRTPSLATDTIIVDSDLGEATMFVGTVDSYLDIVYEFQVAANNSFDDFDTRTVTYVTGLYASATFSGLSGDADYYCRVKAVAADYSAESEWSTLVRFDLVNGVSNLPPSTPMANFPVDGDTITTLTPTLAVNNSTDPDGDILTYDIELYNATATTLLSSSVEIPEGNQTTGLIVSEGLLSENGWFSWRTRAFDGDLYSGWSAYSRFFATTLGTGIAAGSPEVYVYPNPVRFTQGEQATFVLPSEPSDLLILSVSGATVLFKSGLSNNWIWDGNNASGHQVAAAVYTWYVVGSDYKGKIMVKP
jgi:hypothetical protein